jgi:transposase
VPVLARAGCPAKIEKSKNSFDYWLTVENEFEKRGGVAMPVRSHRKLNDAIKDRWALDPVAEFFKDKNGRFYARVFVQKEVAKAESKNEFLGCDVGYRHGACDSDGHIGTNTGREKKAQRQRQGLKVSGPKSRIKQLLDREAKRAVDVAMRTSRSLAIESPKQIANLRSGSLHGWARCYFANRCHVLGKEKTVFVWEVNPAHTSQICSQCGHKDAQSRSGIAFVCTACSHKAHADVNAARNIARKGAVSIRENAIRNRKRSCACD